MKELELRHINTRVKQIEIELKISFTHYDAYIMILEVYNSISSSQIISVKQANTSLLKYDESFGIHIKYRSFISKKTKTKEQRFWEFNFKNFLICLISHKQTYLLQIVPS